jgi:hypothetical protein
MPRIVVFTAAAVATASLATAQPPAASQSEPSCAIVPANVALPETPLRISGGQDSAPRTLFGPRDVLVIDGGTTRGVQLNQTFYVRRLPRELAAAAAAGQRGIVTAGWVRIIGVNETMALAAIDRVCDAIYAGDYLQPFGDPPPPMDSVSVDTGLDFSAPARMVFGPYEKQMAAAGELVLTNAGQAQGVTPGARFAIYRDVQEPGVPLFAIGEATVVSVNPDTSLVRINAARTAVHQGDVFIPRR